jgi:hypothetical protein
MNFKFHPVGFHITFQLVEVSLNFIQPLMLSIVSSSFQSCVYFNVHGRVTWQALDDDNWLGRGLYRLVPRASRQGSAGFLHLWHKVNTLSSVGQSLL